MTAVADWLAFQEHSGCQRSFPEGCVREGPTQRSSGLCVEGRQAFGLVVGMAVPGSESSRGYNWHICYWPMEIETGLRVGARTWRPSAMPGLTLWFLDPEVVRNGSQGIAVVGARTQRFGNVSVYQWFGNILILTSMAATVHMAWYLLYW